MAILVDPPMWPAHGTLWSHLVSDADYDELHAFAARLGAPRRSFDLDHYDLPASLYERAIALGARAVGPKEVVHRLRDSGLRVPQVERDALRPVRRRQYLDAEWAALGARLALLPGRASIAEHWHRLGESLIARWNEPHRSYHDERHLEDVLLALDHLAVSGERLSPATLLAAWFHDAVYTGRSESDEIDSAGLAVSALGEFGLPPGLVQQVGEFIVATTPARGLENPATALSHLLDADLSIFAASQHRYAQYSMSVRAEYAHLPVAEFSAGRARILSAYLEQPTIYRTGVARRLWEQRARLNLAGEVEALRGVMQDAEGEERGGHG